MIPCSKRVGFLLGSLLLAAVPLLAHAEQATCTNSYSGIQTYTYRLPPGTLDPGPNQKTQALGEDFAGASQDLGKTFFTLQLSTFNDSDCGGEPCRNNVAGIAHRTWPKNSCVAVCNIKIKKCALATVMDHGPNLKLGCRTIDANPALATELQLKTSDLVQATYKLISLPGIPCDAKAIAGMPEASLVDANMRNIPPPVSSYVPPPSLVPSFSPASPLSQSPGYPAQAAPSATQPYAYHTLPQPTPVSDLITPSSGIGGTTATQQNSTNLLFQFSTTSTSTQNTSGEATVVGRAVTIGCASGSTCSSTSLMDPSPETRSTQNNETTVSSSETLPQTVGVNTFTTSDLRDAAGVPYTPVSADVFSSTFQTALASIKSILLKVLDILRHL